MRPGAGALGHADRGQQLPLGLGPPALGEQDAPVQGAAAGVQEGAAVPVDELVGHLAPLGGPSQVAGQVAGDQHVAAGERHGFEAAMLAAKGARHRLVDEGHAFLGPARRHQRQPEVAEGAQLQVHVPGGPRQLEGLLVELLGAARVGFQVGAHQPQPALQRVRVGLRHDPLGPGQPPAGGGVVVEVGEPGHAQADGGEGGRDGVAGPPELGVGAFGVGDAGPGLAQPPQGRAHAVERLGRLLLGQGGREGGTGLLPPPGLEGGAPGGHGVQLGHGAKYAHANQPRNRAVAPCSSPP